MRPPVDPKRPVRQLNGLPARILATDIAGEQPWAVAITSDDGSEEMFLYSANGQFSPRQGNSSLDLVNTSPPPDYSHLVGFMRGLHELTSHKSSDAGDMSNRLCDIWFEAQQAFRAAGLGELGAAEAASPAPLLEIPMLRPVDAAVRQLTAPEFTQKEHSFEPIGEAAARVVRALASHPCPHCGERFGSEEGRQQHLRDNHGTEAVAVA